MHVIGRTLATGGSVSAAAAARQASSPVGGIVLTQLSVPSGDPDHSARHGSGSQAGRGPHAGGLFGRIRHDP